MTVTKPAPRIIVAATAAAPCANAKRGSQTSTNASLSEATHLLGRGGGAAAVGGACDRRAAAAAAGGSDM